MQNTKQIIISGLILFMLALFGKSDAQESFYVYFMQNGKRINIKDSKVELKKQAFDIYTEYTASMDLLMNAGFDSKTWKAAKMGKLLYNLPAFKKKTMKNFTAFDLPNTLLLNSNASYIWEKNQSDSAANLKSEKGRKINIKKVKKLYSVKDSTIIKPNDYNKNIYLVFIYTQKDKDTERIEIQRETAKINWVKKYEEETKSFEHKKKITAKEKIRTAKQNLKRKQKAAEKEEKRLKKLEKDKQKRLQKEKEKNNRKK